MNLEVYTARAAEQHERGGHKAPPAPCRRGRPLRVIWLERGYHQGVNTEFPGGF